MADVPNREDINSFRRKLISWFRKNGRAYPWRETHDPLKVLIAEMMLRRTKADQVRPIYKQIFSEYPDVESLAEAKNRRIEKIVYPLGLRWRTPAFGLVAKEIRDRYNSKVPDTRDELVTLPGVGDYVAGAVLCIAYGKAEWMVDSNIVRLFQRYFGIETTKEGRRDRHVIQLAQEYSSGKDPRSANLAILDFSAVVCDPRQPHCESCPLSADCHYLRH